MGKKRTFPLIILMAVLVTFLIGGVGCSNDQQETDTNGDTANGDTQQDTPLLTAGEAASLVYDYLDSRLYETVYRNKLSTWGGRRGATYRGDHEWSVGTMYLGVWTAYERTGVVQPQDMAAKVIARDHFR